MILEMLRVVILALIAHVKAHTAQRSSSTLRMAHEQRAPTLTSAPPRDKDKRGCRDGPEGA